MNIDGQLVTVLKNFSQINNAIVFRPGNTLRVINPPQSVVAIARFDEPFPVACGIGDVTKLLNICSVFDEPYVEFSQQYLTIKDHKNKNSETAEYTYTDPRYIVTPPDKDPAIKQHECSFNLSSKQFAKMQKAVAIYEQPDFVIQGDGSNVYIKTANSDSPVRDNFTMKVGITDKTFSLVFARENFPLMHIDYAVFLNKKYAHFKAIPSAEKHDEIYKICPVEYITACKSDNSSFE